MSAIVEESSTIKKDLFLVSNRDLNDKTFTIKLYEEEGNKLHIPLWYARKNNLTSFPKHKEKTKVTFTGTLREYQLDVAEQLKKNLLENGSAFLQLHCGFGKTALATWAIATLKLKGLILVTNLTLISQWLNTCNNLTNGRCIVLSKKRLEEANDADIVISMIHKLNYFDETLSKMFDIVVVDEARIQATQVRSRLLLKVQPKYTLGLSADYKRADGMHKIMEHYFSSNNIVVISSKSFIVYRLNTRFKPKIEFRRYGKFQKKTDWNLIEETISENDGRNRLIALLAKVRPFDKILILCRRKSQVNNIISHLEKLNIECDFMTGTKTSYKNCRVLVCTVSKAGIGFDAQSACEIEGVDHFNLLIMACSVKLIEQNAGRVFRVNMPEIIDIVDDYSQFKKHFEEDRLPWYLSRNGQIVEEWV